MIYEQWVFLEEIILGEMITASRKYCEEFFKFSSLEQIIWQELKRLKDEQNI
jgi:hypothetical protein